MLVIFFIYYYTLKLYKMTEFIVKYTRTLTSGPETERVTAVSREAARDQIFNINPRYYVISVIEA